MNRFLGAVPVARSMVMILFASIVVAGCGDSSLTLSDAENNESATEAVAPAAAAVAAHAGEVLIIGGAASATPKTTAVTEIFRPATKTFIATSSLATSRAGLQAVAFATGLSAHQVLVAGGATGGATIDRSNNTLKLALTSLNTAQKFKDATGTYVNTTNMSAKRVFYTATLLKSGKVLLAGGYSASAPLKTAELFDPATGHFKSISSMTEPRAFHTATLLDDGTVLIVGGITDAVGSTIGTAELFNPTTNKFTKLAGTLPSGASVAGHSATLITGCSCSANNKVLIAGGFSGFSLFGSPATESDATAVVLYNPATKTFAKAGGKLADGRMFHTATLISSGRVLITGGIQGQAILKPHLINGLVGGTRNTAEIYTASTNKMACVGGADTNKHCHASMKNSRAGHTATIFKTGPLAGQVLLAGGVGATKATTKGQGAILSTAELFKPSTKTFSATANMKSGHAFHAAVLVP